MRFSTRAVGNARGYGVPAISSGIEAAHPRNSLTTLVARTYIHDNDNYTKSRGLYKYS
ncbi:hypothetical protein L249_8169, partial [Ophiocordyceps polyrhachis-furcata BCC 54312]